MVNLANIYGIERILGCFLHDNTLEFPNPLARRPGTRHLQHCHCVQCLWPCHAILFLGNVSNHCFGLILLDHIHEKACNRHVKDLSPIPLQSQVFTSLRQGHIDSVITLWLKGIDLITAPYAEPQGGSLTRTIGYQVGVQVTIFALEVLGLKASKSTAQFQIHFLSNVKRCFYRIGRL